MFRCNALSEKSFKTIHKLISKDVIPSRKFTVLKCNNRCGQYKQFMKPSFSTSTAKYARNLVPGMFVVGGTVLFGIGYYKQMFISKVYAAEGLKIVEANVNADDAKPSADAEAVNVPEFPGQVQYLLIGGGTASYSAMRAIRKRDVTAKILIVSDDDEVPYMRPPLSKELWFSDDREAARLFEFKQWNGKARNIFFEDPSYYCKPNELEKRNGGVAIALSKKVVALNPNENAAILKDGTTIKYEKCLIATGGQPRNLQAVEKAGADVLKRTTLYRKASDFIKLDDITNHVKSVTVIGGGFMGSEIACALGHKGKTAGFEVNQVFPESGNMALVLPEYLTKWTTEKVKKEGVNVITESKVTSVSMEGDKVKIVTCNDQEILSDHIVVAVGLDIDTDLAISAGIEVDEKLGGYRVNAELQGRSNIWVAGDASCFYDVKLGRRRVEHHDHAVVSGRLAGENMTGAQKPYCHQSMFWSDLGPEVGYEAIGVVDSRLPTVGVFEKATEKDTPKGAATEGLHSSTDNDTADSEVASSSTPDSTAKSDEFGKGVVFYLRNDKVVGLLLWNVFGRMSVARKLIQDQQSHEDYGEVAKLFKIHSDDLD